MLSLEIVVHCPDRHLSYDGSTPTTAGVGGGVTARIRLAEALARRGHRVEMICNTAEVGSVAGVRYTPLAAAGARDCDVLIPMSTGGALDVAEVAAAGHHAAAVVGWVQGYVPVIGLPEMSPDLVVCCSGYVRDVAQQQWRLPAERLAVVHNGVAAELREPRGGRDPYRLIFPSHPSKGLSAALGVLRALRRVDERYHLAVAGGPALWGQQDQDLSGEPGVHYLGLLGQEELAAEYWSSGHSLHLQHFREPYGIALAEARVARCVPVASAVGAFPELLEHGSDGWLLRGDCDDEQVQQRAADLVRISTGDSPTGLRMRARTPTGVLDWDALSEVWEGLLLHLLGRPDAPAPEPLLLCPYDATPLLALADGLHCRSCGRWHRMLPPS